MDDAIEQAGQAQAKIHKNTFSFCLHPHGHNDHNQEQCDSAKMPANHVVQMHHFAEL